MSRYNVFAGIDSSAYTTSIAVVRDGEIICDLRKPLPVPEGARGLRQSDAVFAHIKNFPELFRSLKAFDGRLAALAYSEKPCPKDDSYMPVFCVGASHAAAAAAAAGADSYALTHQHGHIYSCFFGSEVKDGVYGAFHVSGGTLDILRVIVEDGIVTLIETVGGTLDITLGQLIDRIGVAAGLPFPSGAAMESLYRPGSKRLSAHIDGLAVNLSGAETQALKRLEKGEDAADVCGSVIDCAADTLARLLTNTAEKCGLSRFLFTGGVICNTIIREKIDEICERDGFHSVFAQKRLCSDNACGLALAAEKLYGKGGVNEHY